MTLFVSRVRALRQLMRLTWDTGSEHLADLVVRLKVALRFATRNPTAGASSGSNVLIVDDLVPDPLFGFGFPRMFEVVQSLLRAGHRVSVYPMQSSSSEEERVRRLCDGKARIYRGKKDRGLRRLLWDKGDSFDLIFISRPAPMRAFHSANWKPAGSRPLLVYDLEAVTTPREAQRRQLFGIAWTQEEERLALATELEIARGVDLATAVGEMDKTFVEDHLDLSTRILSFPVRMERSQAAFEDRADILLVGRLTGPSSHFPNLDAAQWFVTEVMPRLDALIGPLYRVNLVGMFDAETTQLASDRVILHGALDDLAPMYERCRVFIAPTRYAAGLPIKIVETIGRGLPCVTTPVLARQVGATGHGFTSDPSAAAFAERCALLYTDAAAWEAARAYGLALAQERFSQEAFDEVLNGLARRALDRRSHIAPKKAPSLSESGL